MTYGPAHNFQACDVKDAHTLAHGLTPFPVAKGRQQWSRSTAVVLTSVVRQCVSKKKEVMLHQSECVPLDAPRGSRAGGAEPRRASGSLEHTHTHTLACLCAESVVFGEKGNKTRGRGSAIFRLKWKIYKRCGSSV